MNVLIEHKEFWKILNERISLGNYEFKFLRPNLERIKNNEQDCFGDSLININETGWILLILSDEILVYGENWNENQIVEISELVKLSIFTNYQITGNSELIDALLNIQGIDNIKVIKERLFYRASTVQLNSDQSVRIDHPTAQDFGKLTQMFQQYYHEEYHGKNDKSISEMEKKVREHTANGSIRVLKNGSDELISFCTILNPDIGILFTNSKFRNGGYGKLLLAYCSKLLLNRINEVFLMTDKNRIESNAACKRIGYKSYFEYKWITINNS